jgi:uncharacterized protein YcbK (DUF882 family)
MKLDKKTILTLAGIMVATIIVASILFKKKTSNKNWFLPDTTWFKDGNSKAIIEKLHPKFRNMVAELFTRAEKELGLTLYATSGYRTYAEQVALHKQNSSNAKAGFSSHNFGFAVDLNVRKNGITILKKANSNQQWINSGVVGLAKKIGIDWVGDFGSYHDPVHFFLKPNGLSTSDLRAMYDSGKKDNSGYVLV